MEERVAIARVPDGMTLKSTAMMPHLIRGREIGAHTAEEETVTLLALHAISNFLLEFRISSLRSTYVCGIEIFRTDGRTLRAWERRGRKFIDPQ